jgi:hypothetical protein
LDLFQEDCVAVTDAGRGREVLEAEDFPLRDLIALAKEQMN